MSVILGLWHQLHCMFLITITALVAATEYRCNDKIKLKYYGG